MSFEIIGARMDFIDSAIVNSSSVAQAYGVIEQINSVVS
jgi:hypothetical protein